MLGAVVVKVKVDGVGVKVLASLLVDTVVFDDEFEAELVAVFEDEVLGVVSVDESDVNDVEAGGVETVVLVDGDVVAVLGKEEEFDALESEVVVTVAIPDDDGADVLVDGATDTPGATTGVADFKRDSIYAVALNGAPFANGACILNEI